MEHQSCLQEYTPPPLSSIVSPFVSFSTCAASAASHACGAALSPPVVATFPAFFAHVCRSGLSVVSEYPTSSLLALAEQSVTLEEKVATGCLLIQAVTLLEYFHRTRGRHPSQHRTEAQDFHSSSTSLTLQRPSAAAAAVPFQHREVTWRAKFAVRLYEILGSAEFIVLQPLLMQTCVSTLHLLQRLWHKDNLALFAKLLQYVSTRRIGSRVVAGCLALWQPETLKRAMTNDEQDALVAEFQQRAEHLLVEQPRLKGKRKKKIPQEDDFALLQAHASCSPSDVAPTGCSTASSSAATSDASSVSAVSSASSVSATIGTVSSAASSAPALSSVLSGCMVQLAEEPDVLSRVDLPLDFTEPPVGSEMPVRTSARLLHTAHNAASAKATGAATAGAADVSTVSLVSDRSTPLPKRRKIKAVESSASAVEFEEDGTTGPEQPERTAAERPCDASQPSASMRTTSQQQRARVFRDGASSAPSSTASPSWTCIMPNDDASIFPFDTDALPAEFRNYAQFLQTHGSRVGRVIRYTRSTSHVNRFVLHAVDAADRMRVSEWHQRFLEPYMLRWADASQRTSITEVLYLTDISLPHLSHRQLRRSIPLLAACDETGALTLNAFIQAAHGPHIATPDVEARLYLSPPTDGYILTPAHYDGHGTQTSIHAVLFGGHNLVYTFPGERSVEQETELRKAVGIAPIGAAQHLPHQQSLHFSTGSSTWDDAQLAHCERIPGLRVPESKHLRAGQVMFIPTGLVHIFKKVSSLAEESSPMLGYPGDSSYIGCTRESVRAHAAAILRASQALRLTQQPQLCSPMLGILSVCHLASGSADESLHPLVEQVAGLLPLFEQYTAEEKAVLARLGRPAAAAASARFTVNSASSAPLLVDVQEAVSGHDYGEWVCGQCNGEIANLHAWHRDARSSSPLLNKHESRHYTCIHCLSATPELTAAMTLAVRFHTMEQLESIRAACRQVIAAASAPSSLDMQLLMVATAADDLQRAEDARVEQRCEELRAVLPLHTVLSLPGMRPARKTPARVASFNEQRIRDENKRQLAELEAAVAAMQDLHEDRTAGAPRAS